MGSFSRCSTSWPTALTAVAAAATLLISAATASLPASAALPAKAAPQGMVQLPSGGSGRIFTSHMGGTGSARKMLMALKMVAGEYFDGPPTVTRAFADPADRNLQAAFTAKLKGVPVRGVVAVAMDPDGGNGGQGSLIFDDAKTFTKSFRTLTAKLSNEGGGKAAPIRLTPQDAPDGSGRVSLPPGFRITGAYKGTMDIAGPDGAAMALGAPILCTRREAAAMFPGIPPVDFNNPVQAAVDYMNYQARKSGVPMTARILDARPVQGWTTGRAAFIRYTVQASGKSFEGFGLFSISQTDVNQGLLYMSYIAAPTSSYRKHFPGMMAAWGSWSVNPSVFRERLMAAAESMRGMSDIISSVNENRQATYARVNEAWDDYIRDQDTWSNPNTGARYKLPTSMTNLGTPTQGGVPLQPVPIGQL